MSLSISKYLTFQSLYILTYFTLLLGCLPAGLPAYHAIYISYIKHIQHIPAKVRNFIPKFRILSVGFTQWNGILIINFRYWLIIT